MTKIRLALAQSDTLFRQALASLLKTQVAFEIVLEAANGKELLEQLKHKPVDIALIENNMPVRSGKETLQLMQARFPEIKVIVLGDNESIEQSLAFMGQGASCFLTYACSAETLFRAIENCKPVMTIDNLKIYN